MRSYPSLGNYGTGYVNMRKTCQECSKPNRMCLEIQVSYFRGDDAVINICPDCKRNKSIEELLALAK